MKRDENVRMVEVYVNGQHIEDGILKDIKSGEQLNVLVKLPVLD